MRYENRARILFFSLVPHIRPDAGNPYMTEEVGDAFFPVIATARKHIPIIGIPISQYNPVRPRAASIIQCDRSPTTRNRPIATGAQKPIFHSGI